MIRHSKLRRAPKEGCSLTERTLARRSPRCTLRQNPYPLPLPLLALGVLVDGCESNPAFVRADAQAGNAAVALIADHVKTADPRAAVIEAAEQGLWLGMALAYRFTQNPEQK